MPFGSDTTVERKPFASRVDLCPTVARILLVAAMMVCGFSTPSTAFELFGYEFGTDGIKAVSEDTQREDIPDPVRYDVTLVSTDEEMLPSLEEASLLVGQQDKPASGTTGLLLRVRNDQKRLISTLYRSGRYGGTVDITVDGRTYDQIPLDENLNAKGPARVEIKVIPGAVFAFSNPKARSSDGSTVSLADLGIIEGQAARSELVLDAENALVDRYRKQGYPFARITDRSLEADHDTRTLEVSLEVDPGRQARLGRAQVSGATSVDADFIVDHADMTEGALYSPQELQAATKRLRSLGVFESVVVKTAETVDADGTVPVIIDVKERKHRTLGAGVTMGNLDGIGLEAFWTHRNLFGRAESLRVEASVSRIGQDPFSDLDYHGAVLFSKPGIFGPAGTFEAELAADFTNPDAYQKRAISGEIGVRYDFSDQVSGRVGLKTEFARITDSTGTEHSLLTSIPLELSYDTRDNKLDPSKGFQILLEAEPTISNRDNVRFFKASATATAYQALDKAKRFVIAGKLSAGSIVGASKSNIPADRRYFTGGGGSIRGYAYQAAGPRDTSNDPEGGRSFALASLEARVRVTDSIGLAAFVDTGGAFDSTLPGTDGDWYTGVGAGVRYLTPIGPLRLDVAIPLKKIEGEPQYGVYLGLGQAF
ncbi:autotransporter assembly complex protein TamA [Cohaesibacter celericrescens]|nr:autotransporter assembly complex family protein [Cohaesibacter celericrescens]